MPIPTCNAPSSASTFPERSAMRATSTLPRASPHRKVVNIALKAYVEFPTKKVSARVQITS